MSRAIGIVVGSLHASHQALRESVIDLTPEEYLAAVEIVQAACGDMSRELLFARPVAGMWSSQEVLCHLVDTDLTVALRIRAALTRDCPRLQTATREDNDGTRG